MFSSADLLFDSEGKRVMTGPTRKVLLVVNGRLFRDGLRSLMHASGLTVVGHCDTLKEAVPLIAKMERPDLVVVDMHTTADDVQALQDRLPGTRWILLCDHRDAHKRVIGADFDWILFQDISAEILHHVVELMLLGHSRMPRDSAMAGSPASTETMTPGTMGVGTMGAPAVHGAALAEPMPGIFDVSLTETPRPEAVRAAPAILPGRLPEPQVPPPFAQPSALLRPTTMLPAQDIQRQRTVHLSDRESEILQCLVNGASNKAIARELNIAEATVKVHVKGLLRKMQLQNRTQAAIWAVSHPMPTRHRALPPPTEENE